jgi:DMSO/TMAO reductase YedYZ molybdopterin-dependent catalytic subunit
MKFRLLAALLALAVGSGRLAADPALTVTYAGTTLNLSSDDVKALPHSDVTALDPHEKVEHRYSGISVRDLLTKVGVPMGEKLRGNALQLAVLLKARDGYSTLFAAAEFDDQFSDRTLLLADSMDGGPLPANAVPFRLIAPGDKRAARWARMVTSIEVVKPGGP